MAGEIEIAENIEKLHLNDDEDELLQPDDEGVFEQHPSEFVFVGRFLTTAVIYLEAMRNNLANYWRPEHGVDVKELGDDRYLFEFFHEVDYLNVLEGGPFHFNNHLLLLHPLQKGEDPMQCPLNHTTMWVQVHGLLPGSWSEGMAKLLGNFIGTFVDYDAKSIANGQRNFMRIRVCMDVRTPLKRRKKIAFGGGRQGYVNFRYEKLTLFCFLCGTLVHHDRACPRRFQPGGKDLQPEWSIELRAPNRRQVPVSQFLRVGGIGLGVGKTSENCGTSSGISGIDLNYSNADLVGSDKGNISNNSGEKENMVPMDQETEDLVAVFVDGNKRPRDVTASPVSRKDSKGVSTGLQAQNPNISAGLNLRARRAQ